MQTASTTAYRPHRFACRDSANSERSNSTVRFCRVCACLWHVSVGNAHHNATSLKYVVYALSECALACAHP